MKNYKKIAMLAMAAVLCVCLVVAAVLFLKPAHDVSFLAWTDGYLAAEKDSKNPMAFTCFYNNGNKPFEDSALQSIWFVGLREQILVSDIDITEKPNTAKYESYAITVNISAAEIGIFAADKVVFQLADGTELTYPIGQWTFDIGTDTAPPEMLDAWQSVAASSNGKEFPYLYKPAEGVKIVAVQTGKDAVLADKAGIAEDGKIAINSEAPISYIKSKITVEKDGKEYITYGKGCYCGAMNIPENVIDKMSERPKEK